ncbi:MAG: ADP-glyceromanno-heptose 6-epimerase [Methylacidiphilales bacterium]|nr:ADP-glyceromanno-heptose 6-epimerase [Candidatus Methylacidiphilales bacterium]MDW8350166.1 ADP-glyceromanno-heptose 6-epimerase [Verrucomicrobiae bacterium]
MKNILITGGAGFIGANLALKLQEEYPSAKLTIIDDFRSASFKNLQGYRGDFIAADLATLDLSRYFRANTLDAIFHLASITDTTNHNQFQQVHDNVESFRNLLHFVASKSNKTRIMFASSAATYGIASGVNTLDQPLHPANVYAFSKVQLENLARLFLRSYPSRHIVGLRYFNVYGPREAHKGTAASMIYQLAQQIKAGQNPRIFKFGEQRRDFVYIKDIVELTIRAITTARKSGIYNAGSGTARSFNDVVTILNRTFGTDLETEYFDNPYPFYQPHTEADMSVTIKALRYKPQYTLEKGILDYFQSGHL